MASKKKCYEICALGMKEPGSPWVYKPVSVGNLSGPTQIIFVFFLFFFLSKWYRSWKLNKVSSVTYNILHSSEVNWCANISK